MNTKRIFRFTIMIIAFFISCGDQSAQPSAIKLLPPVRDQVVEKGAIMIVDNGIIELINETKDVINHIILIPGNDSIKEVVTCAYEGRIDNGCRVTLAPWIQVNGSYLRKDSLTSILKFTNAQIIDECSACSLTTDE